MTILAPDSVRGFNMEKFLEHETQLPLVLYNSAFVVVVKAEALHGQRQAPRGANKVNT